MMPRRGANLSVAGPIARRSCVFLIIFVAVSARAVAQSPDPNQLPTAPALGRYANTLSKICGRNRVDVNPTKLPFIGCFALRAGTSLSGKIDGRAVTIGCHSTEKRSSR